jgi:hypothetical protein
MKMKLPRHVSFHHDLRLMVWRPLGILREEQVNQIVAFLEKEEDRAEKPFTRFTDTSKLDAVDLDPQFIVRVSLHRRLVYAGRPPVKSAFYVTSDAVSRLVQIHILMTDHSPLECAMFESLEDTAKWLDVSTDTLKMGDDDLKERNDATANVK